MKNFKIDISKARWNKDHPDAYERNEYAFIHSMRQEKRIEREGIVLVVEK